MADTSLTGLTASFTLPSGLVAKVRMFSLAEGKRWKDSEGFVDAGYQTGKLTGQGIAGRIVGFITTTATGLGTQFENVSVTVQVDVGRTLTLNVDITDIELGASVGELQSFMASFRSNGVYTNTTI